MWKTLRTRALVGIFLGVFTPMAFGEPVAVDRDTRIDLSNKILSPAKHKTVDDALKTIAKAANLELHFHPSVTAADRSQASLLGDQPASPDIYLPVVMSKLKLGFVVVDGQLIVGRQGAGFSAHGRAVFINVLEIGHHKVDAYTLAELAADVISEKNPNAHRVPVVFPDGRLLFVPGDQDSVEQFIDLLEVVNKHAPIGKPIEE